MYRKKIPREGNITSPTGQLIFGHTAECKYKNIFGILNDWIIVNVQSKKKEQMDTV